MEVDELTSSFGVVRMHDSGPMAVDDLAVSFSAVTMRDAGAAAIPVAPVHHDEPAAGEEACTLRVRFPDGQIICKSFGPWRPVTALFRHCQSVLAAGYDGTVGTRPFRLVTLAGGATEEIDTSGRVAAAGSRLHRASGLLCLAPGIVRPDQSSMVPRLQVCNMIEQVINKKT